MHLDATHYRAPRTHPTGRLHDLHDVVWRRRVVGDLLEESCDDAAGKQGAPQVDAGCCVCLKFKWTKQHDGGVNGDSEQASPDRNAGLRAFKHALDWFESHRSRDPCSFTQL